MFYVLKANKVSIANVDQKLHWTQNSSFTGGKNYSNDKNKNKKIIDKCNKNITQ